MLTHRWREKKTSYFCKDKQTLVPFLSRSNYYKNAIMNVTVKEANFTENLLNPTALDARPKYTAEFVYERGTFSFTLARFMIFMQTGWDSIS